MDRLWYLIPIALVVVLLFGGATRLPEIGAGLGRAIREFRGAVSGSPDQVSSNATPVSLTSAYGQPSQWAPVPEQRPAAGPDDSLRT